MTATPCRWALGAFYASIGRIADEGLSASLTNERAYVDAGRQMLALMDGLTDLDAASRVVAASADLGCRRSSLPDRSQGATPAGP